MMVCVLMSFTCMRQSTKFSLAWTGKYHDKVYLPNRCIDTIWVYTCAVLLARPDLLHTASLFVLCVQFLSTNISSQPTAHESFGQRVDRILHWSLAIAGVPKAITSRSRLMHIELCRSLFVVRQQNERSVWGHLLSTVELK